MANAARSRRPIRIPGGRRSRVAGDEIGWPKIRIRLPRIKAAFASALRAVASAPKSVAKAAIVVAKKSAAATGKVLERAPLVKKAMRFAAKVARNPLELAPTTWGLRLLAKGMEKAGLKSVATILRSPEKLAQTIGNMQGAMAAAIVRGNPKALRRAVNEGMGELQKNPAFVAALTGVSVVPGLGPVSGGVAAAVALGSGASLRDAALAGAKASLPGGPVAAAAFDLGAGLARGKKLSEAALLALREQLPGGPAAKAAFDAAVLIARRKGLSPEIAQATLQALPLGQQPVLRQALAAGAQAQKAANAARAARRGDWRGAYAQAM